MGGRIKEVRGVRALPANLGLSAQTEILPIPYKAFLDVCARKVEFG